MDQFNFLYPEKPINIITLASNRGKGVREIRYTSRREDVSTETGTSTSCFGDNDFDCTPMSIKATLVGFSVTCVSFIIEASLKRLTVLLLKSSILYSLVSWELQRCLA